jgi:threonine dehydratase
VTSPEVEGAPEPAVSRDDVLAAAERIRGHVRRTPVLHTAAGELGVDVPLVLKLELLQHAGSFKPRGAFNRILAAQAAGEVPPAGLVAASGGNHGAAVAFAARRLGLSAEIFVPATSPPMKRDRITSYGATVRVVDGLYDDAQAAADERRAATGALLVHPYDHPQVVAGQGTLAVELDEQLPAGYDTLVVASGGGGFTAGQAAWVRDSRRVVSVEPANSRCLQAALAAGEPVEVPVSGVASDSLGAKRLGAVAWSIVRSFVDSAVVVDDDQIRAAQRALWDELRLVAEPGGATALAAIRAGAYVPADGERVVVVVCGSNCDPATVIAPA